MRASIWRKSCFIGSPWRKCDWSAFPTLTLPEPEVRHYHDQYGDDLFVRNVYEVRHMVYTIYNALGKEPSAWRDGKPLATVETVIPPECEAYTAKFWPWRESEDAVCQGNFRKTTMKKNQKSNHTHFPCGFM